MRGGACCHKEILGESRTEGEMEPDCLRSVLRQRFLTFWGGAEQVKVSVTVGAARQESLLELVWPKCMSGEPSQWCSEEL